MTEQSQAGHGPEVVGVPQSVLDVVHFLWVLDAKTDQIVGWWYHPNRAAMEAKRDALAPIEGIWTKLVRYERCAGDVPHE